MADTERARWHEEAQDKYIELNAFWRWWLRSDWGGPIRLGGERWLFWCSDCKAPDIARKCGYDHWGNQGTRLDCIECTDKFAHSVRTSRPTPTLVSF